MVDVYMLSVIGFFIILGALVWSDRKNIEFHTILIMRRTKRFGDIIDKIANLCPRFWKLVSTIAILACFYFMLQGFSTLLIYKPAVQVVLPSISSTASSGPGYLLIPFWFWIIAVASIIVPHEFLHGVVARAEKIPLKSVGLLLLLVFPGAFVEPDEAKLKKAKIISKLRVFAAGSFANFTVATLVFILASNLVWPMYVSNGVKLIDVNTTSPAYYAGLRPDMILTEINGKEIKTTYREYLSGAGYFWEEVGFPKPNETVSVKIVDGNVYNITLSEYQNKTYMGIVYTPVYKLDSWFLIQILMPLMTMIWLFSFAVGVFNVLPIHPLDGGLMIEAITDEYMKKYSKPIVRTITAITVILILYGLFGKSILFLHP